MSEVNQVTTIGLRPPQVPIELEEEKMPTDEVVEADLKALGLVKINKNHITMLARVGAKLEGIGAIRTQRGAAFVSQVRLNEVIDCLHSLMFEKATKENEEKLSIEEACAISHAIAFATGKLTEAQKLAIDMEPRKFALPPPPNVPAQTPFPAAVVVQSGATANFNGGKTS